MMPVRSNMKDDRAGFAEIAAGFGEIGADVGGGAVAVVGQRLDDDRDAARAIALIADFVVVLALAADRLLDRALDDCPSTCSPGAPR